MLPCSIEAFVALILLISWMKPPTFADRAWDVVEFFAGTARVSRLATARGWQCLCHDWDYDRDHGPGKHNCMDMNGAAGYV